MATVCVDTQFVLWGVRRVASSSQEHKIDECQAFLAHLDAQGHRVVIPAIVLAESMVQLPDSEKEAFINDVHQRFVVVPFDVGGALHYAPLMAKWIEERKHESSVTSEEKVVHERQHAKTDHLIVASAKGYPCQFICAEDKGVRKFAASAGVALMDMREVLEGPLFNLEPEGQDANTSS